MAHPTDHPPQPDRRDFFAKAAAIGIGGALALTAPVAGLFVALDPLRRKTAGGGAVRVATLAALPDDGVPRKFPVLADRQDAWNRSRNVPVGAVYLRREKGGAVRAFNVVCPHAGCFVDFRSDRGCYLCPCHNSTFALDGKVLDATSPAPRALDELTAEVRGGEIWVAFQNYRPGEKERIPV